jgi:opacity protein-like surface antigen
VGDSFALPAAPKSYATRLDYSISAGYSRFNQPQYSIQMINLTTPGIPPPIGLDVQLAELTQLHTGWNIAPKVTLNSWRYVSNEFGYSYNSAALTISQASGAQFPPTYEYFDGQLRQFTYNALFHARPNGKRFRPYAAIGPSFQLLRLTDSKPQKNSLLRFTVKDVGIIVDAYDFGSRPPLEGGGIFQFGFQYGGGFKYQVTPHFALRSDFRGTLSEQPDYWTKSYPSINSFSQTNGLFNFGIGPLIGSGPLRHQSYTSGFAFSF